MCFKAVCVKDGRFFFYKLLFMYVCILKKIFENPLKNNKNETEIIRCIYDDLKLAAHVQ